MEGIDNNTAEQCVEDFMVGRKGLPKEGEVVAVRFKNNWDGEGDIQLLFALIKNGEWLSEDTAKPLLEYEGDEVIEWWPLRPGTGFASPQDTDLVR